MKIFLSGVSEQFRECREALKSDFQAAGAEVVEQEDFQQHGRTLLEKLESYIAGCDRVIALIGSAYGWEPPAGAFPGNPRRSYSQWEYFFAQGERLDGTRHAAKDIHLYFAGPEFRGEHTVAEPDDVVALQEAFVAALESTDKDRGAFDSLNELRAAVLRDSLKLGSMQPQPELVLELFDVREDTRFFYGARRIPLLGRTAELDALQEFLDGEARFSWWFLTGPAGIGKSRAALELCLRNAATWHAGWLTRNPFNDWKQWQPQRPTLVVVDEAGARADAVCGLIASLSGRANTLRHPVRILLLERDMDRKALEAFQGSGAERHALIAGQFREPLELRGLDEPELWEAIQSVVQPTGTLRLPARDRTLAALHEIDPQHRPLFASFAADAIAAGRNIEQWDRKELLASVLRTETSRWQRTGVSEEEKNLLAVATMTGGFPVTILKTPPVEGFFPEPRRYSAERYRAMSAAPGERTLAPLAPSVLGEFFVLEHLDPMSDLDDRAQLARVAAMEIRDRLEASVSSRLYFRFLEKAARDFPGHRALAHLRPPLPTPRTAAFAWGIEAANLIEALEEPANAGLCRQVFADLRNAAFEPASKKLATVRYRAALSAVNLIKRFGFSNDPDAAAEIYEELRGMATADPALGDKWFAGGALLVLVLSSGNRLRDAETIYQELRSAEGKGEDPSGQIAPLGMAAGTLTRAHAGAGELTVAQERYRELKDLWARERAAASDSGPTRFRVQPDGLGAVDFGRENWTAELTIELAKAAAVLVEALAATGDLSKARSYYDELQGLLPSQTVEPQPVPAETADGKPGPEAVFGRLVLEVLGMALKPLGGRSFSLTPASHPEIEGPLRERLASSSLVMIQAYAAAGALKKAAEVYETLNSITRGREEPTLASAAARGAYRLLQAAADDDLVLARSLYERLLEIEALRPESVPVRARASAIVALIGGYQRAGDDAALRSFAEACRDFLFSETASAALNDLYGQDQAGKFLSSLENLFNMNP